MSKKTLSIISVFMAVCLIFSSWPLHGLAAGENEPDVPASPETNLSEEDAVNEEEAGQANSAAGENDASETPQEKEPGEPENPEGNESEEHPEESGADEQAGPGDAAEQEREDEPENPDGQDPEDEEMNPEEQASESVKEPGQEKDEKPDEEKDEEPDEEQINRGRSALKMTLRKSPGEPGEAADPEETDEANNADEINEEADEDKDEETDETEDPDHTGNRDDENLTAEAQPAGATAEQIDQTISKKDAAEIDLNDDLGQSDPAEEAKKTSETDKPGLLQGIGEKTEPLIPPENEIQTLRLGAKGSAMLLGAGSTSMSFTVKLNTNGAKLSDIKSDGYKIYIWCAYRDETYISYDYREFNDFTGPCTFSGVDLSFHHEYDRWDSSAKENCNLSVGDSIVMVQEVSASASPTIARASTGGTLKTGYLFSVKRNGNNYEVSVSQPTKGKAVLTLKDENNQPIEGAAFDLYSEDQGNAARINTRDLVTDENGIITYEELDPGTYYFSELSVPSGYVMPGENDRRTESFTVKSGETAEQTFSVSMVNQTEKKGKITLTLTDSHGNALPGAAFNLWRGTDQLVNEDDLTTNNDGQIIADDLEPGTYHFQEIGAPSGYVLPTGGNENSAQRTIEPGHADVQEMTVAMTNQPETKGSVTLKLKQVNTETPLAGGVFDFYRTGRAQKENQIQLITDQAGEIIIENIAHGTYYFVETNAPAGYVLPDEAGRRSASFEVKAGQLTEQTFTLNMTNQPEAKGTITLTLTAAGGSIALQGAEFNLFRKGTGEENDHQINQETLTTDAQGKITVSDLNPGTYYFKEIGVPSGYVLPAGEEAKSEECSIAAGQAELQPVGIEMTNQAEAKGTITLTLTAAGGSPALQGARFDLYLKGKGEENDWQINQETLTTNAQGQITVSDLNPGTYYFKEIGVPSGYVLPAGDEAKSGECSIAAGQSVIQMLNVAMTNQPETKGSVTLTLKALNGNEPLNDAEFDFYLVTGNEEDRKVNTAVLITDAVGKITVGNLEPGSYYFTETKAPAGYVLPDETDRKTGTFEVKAGQSTDQTFMLEMTNQAEAKGTITLTLTAAGGSPALQGARFDLYLKGKGEENDWQINQETLTTNAQGQITVSDLNPGTYYFKEIGVPSGYVLPAGDAAKSGECSIAAGQAELQPVKIAMTNQAEAKGTITLTLTAAGGSPALQGARFDLYLKGTGDETDQKINPETLTTDVQGQITVSGLNPGTYYFVETVAPSGYVLPAGDEAKSGECSIAAGQVELQPVDIEMTNQAEAKGTITLTLTAAGGSPALQGARFDLYRKGTGEENDQQINQETLTSNALGQITVSDLDPGTYYFIEIGVPSGYVLPAGDEAKSGECSIAAGQSAVQMLNVAMTNRPETKGSVTLTLKALNGNEPLNGAEFDFYFVTGNEEDRKINTAVLITDVEGKITVGNLEPGSYYFAETKAPTGYVLPDETGRRTGTFEVKAGQSAEQTFTLEMTNQAEAKGSVIFTVKDSSGNPLAGAEFDLYRIDGNKGKPASGLLAMPESNENDRKVNVSPLVSDENGQITMDELEPGEYYFVQTKAPYGFEMPTGEKARSQTFTVAAGQTSQTPMNLNYTNTVRMTRSITLTARFGGTDHVPKDFRIRAVSAETGTLTFTGNDACTGDGLTDPLTWLMENLPVGSRITFTEDNLETTGFMLIGTGNGTVNDDSSGNRTVLIDESIQAVSFVNTYSRTSGSGQGSGNEQGSGSEQGSGNEQGSGSGQGSGNEQGSGNGQGSETTGGNSGGQENGNNSETGSNGNNTGTGSNGNNTGTGSNGNNTGTGNGGGTSGTGSSGSSVQTTGMGTPPASGNSSGSGSAVNGTGTGNRIIYNAETGNSNVTGNAVTAGKAKNGGETAGRSERAGSTKTASGTVNGKSIKMASEQPPAAEGTEGNRERTGAPVTLRVRKIWNDEGNKSGMRPKRVRLTLWNQEGMILPVLLYERSGWMATVSNLPAYTAGGEICRYYWTEDDSLGYVRGEQLIYEDQTALISSLWEREKIPEDQKPAGIPGRRYTEEQEYFTPSGVSLLMNNGGACFD